MGRSAAGCCLVIVSGCAFGFELDRDEIADAPPVVDGPSASDAPAPADSPPAPDLIVPDASPIDAPPCVAGDARVVDPATGHCYTHHQSPLNWSQAQAACVALGPNTSLAEIESQGENDVIFSIVGERRTWMGGSDQAAEGVWVWTSGAPWGVFTRWRSGEPGNGGGGVPGEDCLEMASLGAGEWNDNECYVAAAYVCERHP